MDLRLPSRSALVMASIAAVSAVAPEGCASKRTDARTPMGMAQLASASAETLIAAGGIPWNAGRRLRWNDFAAPPQPGSPASALTAYVLSYKAQCEGSTFTYDVHSIFLPDRSWVKSAMLMDAYFSALALEHEQTHFDLSEVHARQLRHALDDLSDPCDRSSDELTGIVRRIVADDAEMQQRYDRETLNGRDTRHQAEWNDRVRRELQQSGALSPKP